MKKRLLYILSLLVLFYSCNSEEGIIEFSPTFEVYALLPTEGVGDQSFVDIAYRGIESAKQDFNFIANYIIPNSLEEGEEWLVNIASLEKSINNDAFIIIVGTQYMAALDLLNGDYGSNKILFIGGEFNEYEGLAAINHHTYAPSYISSYISMQYCKQKQGVVVAALDADFLSEYIAGFNQGIIDAGGIANAPLYLSNDFSGFEMPDSAYRFTQKLLDENELIFALSAGSNFGIINAARDHDEQRYVVGVDSDQSWMGLSVVSGSVIKHLDLDIYEYIQNFAIGDFESGNITRTMEDYKTEFVINPLIIDNSIITQDIIDLAIEKEKAYLNPI